MGMKVLLPNFFDLHVFFLLTSLILSPPPNFPDSILSPTTPLSNPSLSQERGTPISFLVPPQPLSLSFKREAPAIDWLSCLQATFAPMSLSPSYRVAVHDLEYLKNMSQLLEKDLLKHRFAPRRGC